MNKVVLLILISALYLQGVEWKSYEEGIKIQKQTHKPIMIDIIRTNCHYCSDMEKNVFENEEMSQWIEERFIPVQINLDLHKLPLDLSVTFTPTFYFINKEHKVIKKVVGSWNIEDFKSITQGVHE